MHKKLFFVSIFSLLVWLATSRAQAFSSADSLAQLVNEAWQIIDTTYYDTTFHGANWKSLRQKYLSEHYHSKAHAYAAINEMLAQLEQPATRLLTSEEFAAFLQEVTGQPHDGLGLLELLSVDLDERTKQLVVVSPVFNSPAARAGLWPHDRLTHIEEAATAEMSLKDAMKRLRKPAGQEVKLTITRENQEKHFALRSEALTPTASALYTAVKFEQGRKIGYLALRMFLQNSSAELREALIKLVQKKVQGFILDLRHNPGGSMASCLQIVGAFLGELPIGKISSRGVISVLAGQGEKLTNLPVVVLVNEGTASAAELLAAALQSHQRAILVGARTFGKGLVHGFQQLSDGAMLMVTIGKLQTLSGEEILREGITPEVAIDMPPSLTETVASTNDKQYLEAVKILARRIAPAGDRK